MNCLLPSDRARQVLSQPYGVLSKLSGVDRAVWSRYFTGQRSPTLRQCQIVAERLELERLDFIAALLERVEAAERLPSEWIDDSAPGPSA